MTVDTGNVINGHCKCFVLSLCADLVQTCIISEVCIVEATILDNPQLKSLAKYSRNKTSKQL